MRFSLVLAIAVVLTPAALTARPASGLNAPQPSDLSAAKKVKEEYLKAAPGTGPSGPKK